MKTNLKLGLLAGAASLLLVGGTAFASTTSTPTTPALNAAGTATPKATKTPKPTKTPKAAKTPEPAAASTDAVTSTVPLSGTEDTTAALPTENVISATESSKAFQGKVKSVSSAGFVLDRVGKNANLSLSVDSKTIYFVAGVAAPSLADIKAGDTVVVLADKSAKDAGKVAAVSVLPKTDKTTSVDADPAITVAYGKIGAPSATGFTIKGKLKKAAFAYDVTVSSATKVIVPGSADGSLSSAKANDVVSVYGKLTGKTLAADIVLIAPNTRKSRFDGVFVGIRDNMLVLFTNEGIVNVDASKAIIVQHGNPAAAVTDLKDGHRLSVLGVSNGKGIVTAQVVDEFGSLGRPYAGSTPKAPKVKATPTPKKP